MKTSCRNKSSALPFNFSIILVDKINRRYFYRKNSKDFMSLLNIEDAITHKEENDEIAVGIDFGTTNSLCFWFDGTQIHEIVDIMSSVLYFDEGGNITTQEFAKQEVSSIKRFVGEEKQIEIAGKKFWAEQLAAEVFRKIKKNIVET